MRLTCPNCGARYEVADSMIPPEGRDVQCSSCSTTWFQPGRRTDQQPAVRVARPEPDAAPPAVVEAEAEAEAEAASAEPVEDMAAGSATLPPDDSPDEESPAAQAPVPRRREIDPEVRDILREEAEREARLRRGEADPVETQGEMPLDEEPDDLNRARRRGELEAAEDAFAARAAAPPARDLFPDIDEINSTLRDTGDRSNADADASDIDTLDTAPRRRRGMRIGFLLAIALAAGGAGLYGNAERIAALAPGLSPVLDSYVSAVNSARFWLDDFAQGLGTDTDES
jgi:predicted Zn finger-like uncharacterized protein